ncbi:methylated-dna--protein-cysteine methyltransferase [Luminiphilus syltensis NOR5-1B]|uniref:Methylated-DNA--protein-cysteine methyltransferase n=1 Tax=Luminiphilus syltensis NOR5-1B TaxID=565045 RepID=B8KWC5_9GAMM|nr:methylated-dna--protein-cysteine methyltransferase [Luminiphilus syltensis NOR5-1B]
MIEATDESVIAIHWPDPDRILRNTTYPEDHCLPQALRELARYFSGKPIAFEVPLQPEGTPFQREVWAALLTIRRGETRSYADIAAQIGRVNAARAVGLAIAKNPIPIMIPCHRVVGSNGKLTGFSGGLDRKQWLLELEQDSGV